MAFPAALKARISEPLRNIWPWSLAGILILFDLPPLHVLDFMNFWAGAKLVMAGKVSILYSVDDYRVYICGLFGSDCTDPANVQHEFSYPPHILFFILPFGLLSAAAAFTMWGVTGLASFLAALRGNPFLKLDGRALALVALSPACVITLVGGQNGAFTAALFLGGFYLCESSPVIAGMLFGLLTVKPHLGILIPPALLLLRNWKCIASASLTALTLMAASAALWGIETWQAYVTQQIPFQFRYLQPTDSVIAYQIWMPGPYADAAFVLGLKGAAAWIPWAAAALWAVFESLTALRREGVTTRSVLMLALATLIVLPYAASNDMTMVMGALTVYLAAASDISVIDYMLYGAVWALPMFVVVLKHIHAPLSSAILLAAFACLTLGSRQAARTACLEKATS